MLLCMPRKTYFVKTLRLVTPRIANNLGIPAEAPTFLSPAVDEPRRCDRCPVTYTALVYQAGEVTHAQHYHEESGGIYFHATTSLRVVASLAEMSGFIASLEPVGQLRIERAGGDRYGRAEAVRTREIAIYCQHRQTCLRGLLVHPRDYCELQEGILLELPSPNSTRRGLFYDSKPGDLLPLCSTDELQERERAAFHFHVRDDTLGYSIR
jgi:hypothetical protein